MQLSIQRVYARDCNLNNNGVIHLETICAAAECPTFPLLRKEYTRIEKNQRQAPVPKSKCPSQKGACDYPRTPQDTKGSLYGNVYQVHCNGL